MRPSLPAAFVDRPIAHRALHDRQAGRPENSLAAVRAAMTAGYGIEIDLQPSADGVAMVFHDETLDRLAEATGPVAALGAAELSALRLRGGAEGIPTLAQVLGTVAGQVPLLIELKDQTGVMGASDGRLETATAAALAGYDGPVAVMSFNPSMMAWMRDLAPAIPRGLTTYAFPAEDFPPAWRDPGTHRSDLAAIADFDRVGASFISHDWHDLARPRVAELRAQGWPILCWTIRSPADEAEARKVAHSITFEGYAAALAP